MGRARLIPISRRELSWLREDIRDVLTDPNLRVAIKYSSTGAPTPTGSGFTENNVDIYTWGVFLEPNFEEQIFHRDMGGELGQKVVYVYAPEFQRLGVEPKAGDKITVMKNGAAYVFPVLRFSGPNQNLFFRFTVTAK
jgi:hypothetical protein